MHTAKNRTNLYTFQTCIICQLILVDNLKTSATIEVNKYIRHDMKSNYHVLVRNKINKKIVEGF